MAKQTSEAWTPYGLEAIRIAHLRRRRVLALMFALGLATLWSILASTGTVEERSLEITSEDGNGNRITIDTSSQTPPQEEKPLTVSVSPGRVTRAETGSAAGDGSQITRYAVPEFARDNPVPWRYYALIYGPYILLGLALLALSKRRKDEVNYGIYKGAMPLEMLTAGARAQVLTTQPAWQSLFGKRRADYLPVELVVERMPAEEDT